MKRLFIVNPASSLGKTGRQWPAIEQKLRENLKDFDVEHTKGTGDAIQITRKALKSGYDQIISVGGDGTLNEVINGFFDRGKLINPKAVVSLVMAGTGGDFIKTLGLPRTLEQSLESIQNGKKRKIDLGKISFLNAKLPDRYFINMAGFALAGFAVKNINESKLVKVLGGKAGYLIMSLASSLAFRNKTVRLALDGQKPITRLVRNVAVANGRFQGGGMMMAPEAKTDDGLLDLIIMDGVGRLKLIVKSSLFYSGKHLEESWIESRRVKKIQAHSEEEVLIDIDGENIGQLPISIEVVPKAITLKM